jgi:hypothetical protein
MKYYLTVDGMLSGTGIRDTVEGGYLTLSSLGLESDLILRIETWLNKYAEEHYKGYNDESAIVQLDEEGKAIARLVKEFLSHSKVEYFSDAKMKSELI